MQLQAELERARLVADLHRISPVFGILLWEVDQTSMPHSADRHGIAEFKSLPVLIALL
jgi:hypothetical protein